MRKLFQSNSFFKIFLPVTAIVCVAVGIMTLLFSHAFEKNSVSVLTREYQKNLNMIRNMYTEIQFAVIPSALSVFDDIRIRNFLFSHDFQYDIALSGLAEIDKTHTLNKYIHSIYLYNQDFGYLSTFKGYRDAKNTSDPSLDKLLENPNFRLNSIVPRRALFEGKGEIENLLSYVNGGIDKKTGEVKYAFIFNLSESKIRKMLISDSPENESEFYILDSAGTYLSHPDPALFNTPSAENPVFRHISQNSAAGGSEFVSGSDGKKWLAVWSDQNELGWRFLYLIPEKKLFAEVIALTNRLFIMSMAVLLLSLALLLAATYRIQTGLDFEKKLAGYIQGMSEFSEKRLYAKNWHMGLFRFDIVSDSEKIERHAIQLRRHAWLASVLNDLQQKTLCVHLRDNCYGVISERDSAWFNDDFFVLRKKMVTEFNSEVTAVYASESCSFDEIPALYEILKNELHKTYMISQGLSRKILCAEDGVAQTGAMPQEFDFQALEQAFKTNNVAKATAEIDRLRNYLFEKKEYLLFRTTVVQTGLLAAKIFEKSLDSYLSGGMDGWRSALFQTEQINGFIALCRMIPDSMAHANDFEVDPNHRKITRYVKNYVTDTINDKNLNAALIAGALGLSLNYVRELFKKSEKMSINDYIGLYRVELANQYLIGTDKTVQEICDITGFSNYSYFCTYFKKREGVSPSKYRMNMRISK